MQNNLETKHRINLEIKPLMQLIGRQLIKHAINVVCLTKDFFHIKSI